AGDIRMLQSRKDTALGVEPPAQLRVEAVADEFDGDLALERMVRTDGEIYRAHPALSDLAHKPIGPNGIRGLRGERGGLLNDTRYAIAASARFEQTAHPIAHVSGLAGESRGTARLIEREAFVEQLLYPLPFTGHGGFLKSYRDAQ